MPRLRCVVVCTEGTMCEVGMCMVGMCKVGTCKGASRPVKGLTGELLPLAVSTTLEPKDSTEGVKVCCFQQCFE